VLFSFRPLSFLLAFFGGGDVGDLATNPSSLLELVYCLLTGSTNVRFPLERNNTSSGSGERVGRGTTNSVILKH
jgi:hypothetical protein